MADRPERLPQPEGAGGGRRAAAPVLAQAHPKRPVPQRAPSLRPAGVDVLVAPPSRGGRPHATCRLQAGWRSLPVDVLRARGRACRGGVHPRRIRAGARPKSKAMTRYREEQKELSTRAGPVDLLAALVVSLLWRLPEVDLRLPGRRQVVWSEPEDRWRWLSPIDAFKAFPAHRPDGSADFSRPPFASCSVALGVGASGERRGTALRGRGAGGLSSLGARAVGALITLVTVPLTVRYLGAERFGAWITIGSYLALGRRRRPGTRNADPTCSSAAFGRNDERAAGRPSPLPSGCSTAVAASLLVVGALAGWMVDWPALINVPTRRRPPPRSGRRSGSPSRFSSASPSRSSVVDRVYNSFQEGATANAWGVAANVATLAGVVGVIPGAGGPRLARRGHQRRRVPVKVANAVWLFRSRPHLRPSWDTATRASASRLAARGGQFFLVQIAALVLYSTDNIVIAKVLGVAEVTPYSVAYSIFTLTNVLTTAAFPYLWAAYAEALARRDVAWVLRSLRFSAVAGVASAALLCLPLVLFGEWIVRVWAGPAAVAPRPVFYWMAAWAVVLALANSAMCLLNAAGRVRWQVWVGLLTAVVNLALLDHLVRRFGISGVIAGTLVSYFFVAALPAAVVTMRFVKELRTGPQPGA